VELKETKVVTRPDIREYSEYRDVLRSFYFYKKFQRSGFSFRRFSQMTGLKSPNYLHLIMQGKRNLSVELAIAVAKVLGLDTGEKAYFLALVRLENSLSLEETESARKDLLASVRRIVTREIPSAQKAVLNNWYYLVVRELACLPDFVPEGEWVSRKLRRVISATQADEAITLLIKGKLLQREPNGKWQIKDPVIDTGDNTQDARILSSHIETLLAWARLLPSLSIDERELGILNIPLSSKRIPEFKSRIRRFQDEIIGWLQDEAEPDTVVQLGTYLVPISRAKMDS